MPTFLVQRANISGDTAVLSGTEAGHMLDSFIYCPRLTSGSAHDPLTQSGYRVQRFHAFVPVLGMSQDSGKLVHWFKKDGERVEKGEPLMEVETDKATVEIESPASGILTQVTAQAGDEVPVTRVIAVIVDGEGFVPPTVVPSDSPPNVPKAVASNSIFQSVRSQRGWLPNIAWMSLKSN